jgi:hypothetical protein
VENEKWLLTIVSENKVGKVNEMDFVVDGSIFDATRIIHTFKPKRGWRVFHYRIEKVVGLV